MHHEKKKKERRESHRDSWVRASASFRGPSGEDPRWGVTRERGLFHMHKAAASRCACASWADSQAAGGLRSPCPRRASMDVGSAGSPEVEAVSFRMGRVFVNLSRPQRAVISPTRGWYRGDRLCVLPGVASPMRYPGGTACWWFGLCESSMCIGQSSILSSTSRYPAAGSCHVEYVWPSTARLPVRVVIVFCAAAGPSAPAVAQPCLGGALR